MNRVDRAKQFLPFDALKGLQEELRLREERRSRVEKKELGEEELMELSQAIMKVGKGERIEIIFYYNGHYISAEDIVVAKSIEYRYIVLGTYKIHFEDMLKINFPGR